MGKSKEIRNVAIVGTGVIGASWAALYLARGLNVVATDPAPNAEANLRKYVDAAWKDLTVIGLSPNASRDHLTFTTDMKQALAGADLVQENGPERKDFKIKLFADMDALTPPDSIIASSSSGLTMSVMQSATKHPERCVIGHPFNPPHVVPLVEVVAGRRLRRRRSSGRLRFTLPSARSQSMFEKKLSAMWLTVFRQRCTARLSISSNRAYWMSPIRMRRFANGPGLRWERNGVPDLLFHLGRRSRRNPALSWSSSPYGSIVQAWWKDLRGNSRTFTPSSSSRPLSKE